MPHAIRSDPESWLYPTPQGLYCAPGQFFVDPHRPVDLAVITHGHSDHARGGHAAVLATPETVEIMRVRLGPRAAGALQPAACGETTRINGVDVRLVPAGHILGAAQVVLDWQGTRIVVSGDYKRRHDPTAEPFELVHCDVFITEATFGLPIFRHPDAHAEVGKLLASLATFPDRAHLVSVYSLGKCQRLIGVLRELGYDRPIFAQPALLPLIDLYRRFGIDLGQVVAVGQPTQSELAGQVVMVAAAAADQSFRAALDQPVSVQASGWMRTRKRALGSGAELPLIISDHVDWPELLQTIDETGAADIWITHGRDDALTYAIRRSGRRGKALTLVGRSEDGE